MVFKSGSSANSLPREDTHLLSGAGKLHASRPSPRPSPTSSSPSSARRTWPPVHFHAHRILVAALTYHCMMLLIHTRRKLEDSAACAFPKISSFGDLGLAVCGPIVRFVVDALIVLSQAEFCIGIPYLHRQHAHQPFQLLLHRKPYNFRGIFFSIIQEEAGRSVWYVTRFAGSRNSRVNKGRRNSLQDRGGAGQRLTAWEESGSWRCWGLVAEGSRLVHAEDTRRREARSVRFAETRGLLLANRDEFTAEDLRAGDGRGYCAAEGLAGNWSARSEDGGEGDDEMMVMVSRRVWVVAAWRSATTGKIRGRDDDDWW
ncbi:amino acid transporter family protein [Striga asiatica]|uniref:Amino acid transporter family protein n=1 Tax=Striga asiatica TaxID=4170 RepID=A0A5A7QVQ3_STRAF|nr:amino acid transporter family protein [Striga asiatica]